MAFFTAEQIALLKAQTVRADILVQLGFESGTKRIWNGNTDLEFSGYTWTGLKGYGQVSGLQFSGEPISERFEISLDGIPGDVTNFLSNALAETGDVENGIATVYYAFFDESWQPIGSPVPLKWGYMRKPRVSRSRADGESGGVQRIVIGCENIFYNRSLPPAGRYTDRDQQSRHPGDQICQFQPSLVNKTFTYPDY